MTAVARAGGDQRPEGRRARAKGEGEDEDEGEDEGAGVADGADAAPDAAPGPGVSSSGLRLGEVLFTDAIPSAMMEAFMATLVNDPASMPTATSAAPTVAIGSTPAVAGPGGGGDANPVAGAGTTGMWIFLVTDAMGFAAILITYGVLRARATTWPDAGQRLAMTLAAAMTLTLLLSSLTVLLALAAARAGRGFAARAWLAVTVACAGGFLGAQAYEYRHLMLGPPGASGAPALGLTTDLFASTFYVITGFHGAHVLAGLIVLVAVLMRGRGVPPSPAVVEVAALFWHFVDVAWVPIFTFVYLLPAR